jgi:hypothetical protein
LTRAPTAGAPDVGPLWPGLGVHVVFLSVARKDEVYVRVVLECHEGIGVARAHDPEFAPDRTLLSLLVVPDFAQPASALLAEVAAAADVRFLPATEDWIAAVARELA